MNPDLPLTTFQTIIEELKAILEEISPRDRTGLLGPVDLPPVDMFETAADFVIKTDLPGVDPESIQVNVVRDHIVLRGVKQEPPLASKVNFLCMERTFGPFLRILSLGRPIHPGKISATYHQGCLRIKVAKIVERRGKSISIPVTVPSLSPPLEDDKR